MTSDDDWPHVYADRLQGLGHRLQALTDQAAAVRARIAALEMRLARQATAQRVQYEPNDEVSDG